MKVPYKKVDLDEYFSMAYERSEDMMEWAEELLKKWHTERGTEYKPPEERIKEEERLRSEAQKTIIGQKALFGNLRNHMRPMSECPLWAYAEYCGEQRTLLVADEDSMAVVEATKRIGTPVLESKVGVPDWWFKYELIDQLSYDDERFGKSEIDFIPTKWMPLPVDEE